jgi:hypothetical protein
LDKEKLKEFLRELAKLENKYGIWVTASYEENIDYDYGENPYVCGVSAYLVFSDSEGNEMTLDNLDIDELKELHEGE